MFKDKTNLPVDQKHLNTSTQRPTPPMNSLKIMALLEFFQKFQQIQNKNKNYQLKWVYMRNCRSKYLSSINKTKPKIHKVDCVVQDDDRIILISVMINTE